MIDNNGIVIAGKNKSIKKQRRFTFTQFKTVHHDLHTEALSRRFAPGASFVIIFRGRVAFCSCRRKF